MRRFVFISTTSKQSSPLQRLPDKIFSQQKAFNFLVNDKKALESLITQYNSDNTVFFLDTEMKQGISLHDEINIQNKLDYKPNDLTMEATDLSILKHFDNDIKHKSIGIYGTGNIAFKVALRLAERNAKIYLFGRNKDKVESIVKVLKQITFNEKLIEKGNSKNQLHAFISFVTAEKVITEDYISLLRPNALCLDGGIGNFSKEFIKYALNNGHDVRRLDVRQSNEILEGYINSRIKSHFDEIIGRDTINEQSVVAGGIIGKEGEIIVDRIVNPTKVIGIANGIGGVKDESTLSTEDQSRIKKVQSFIK